jgi:hypothetical protein
VSKPSSIRRSTHAGLLVLLIFPIAAVSHGGRHRIDQECLVRIVEGLYKGRSDPFISSWMQSPKKPNAEYLGTVRINNGQHSAELLRERDPSGGNRGAHSDMRPYRDVHLSKSETSREVPSTLALAALEKIPHTHHNDALVTTHPQEVLVSCDDGLGTSSYGATHNMVILWIVLHGPHLDYRLYPPCGCGHDRQGAFQLHRLCAKLILHYPQSLIHDGLRDDDVEGAIQAHLDQLQGHTAKYEGANPNIAV